MLTVIARRVKVKDMKNWVIGFFAAVVGAGLLYALVEVLSQGPAAHGVQPKKPVQNALSQSPEESTVAGNELNLAQRYGIELILVGTVSQEGQIQVDAKKSAARCSISDRPSSHTTLAAKTGAAPLSLKYKLCLASEATWAIVKNVDLEWDSEGRDDVGDFAGDALEVRAESGASSTTYRLTGLSSCDEQGHCTGSLAVLQPNAQRLTRQWLALPIGTPTQVSARAKLQDSRQKTGPSEDL